MHLRDPDPVGDLGLREVAEEAQQQDRAFPLGELVEQRREGLAVLDLVQLHVHVAEGVGEGCVGAGDQLVE